MISIFVVYSNFEFILNVIASSNWYTLHPSALDTNRMTRQVVECERRQTWKENQPSPSSPTTKSYLLRLIMLFKFDIWKAFMRGEIQNRE